MYTDAFRLSRVAMELQSVHCTLPRIVMWNDELHLYNLNVHVPYTQCAVATRSRVVTV